MDLSELCLPSLPPFIRYACLLCFLNLTATLKLGNSDNFFSRQPGPGKRRRAEKEGGGDTPSKLINFLVGLAVRLLDCFHSTLETLLGNPSLASYDGSGVKY